MYMQFKHGFVEVDRWDGSLFAESLHQQAVSAAAVFAPDLSGFWPVMIVRSREKSTIQWISKRCARHPVIFHTPTWDYAYRCYLSEPEWVQVVTRIIYDVDYRNFKTWTKNSASLVQSKLAHDIWEVAYTAGVAQRSNRILPPVMPTKHVRKIIK